MFFYICLFLQYFFLHVFALPSWVSWVRSALDRMIVQVWYDDLKTVVRRKRWKNSCSRLRGLWTWTNLTVSSPLLSIWFWIGLINVRFGIRKSSPTWIEFGSGSMCRQTNLMQARFFFLDKEPNPSRWVVYVTNKWIFSSLAVVRMSLAAAQLVWDIFMWTVAQPVKDMRVRKDQRKQKKKITKGTKG